MKVIKSIRGNRVLLNGAKHPVPATLYLESGKIARIEHGPGSAPCDLDAGDRLVMPGVVDTHAHINEPGRTEWEGFGTATRAAAAGGITTVVDMPLNSIPATTTLQALKLKAAAAEGACTIDYGFWGGVVPGNSSELEPMVQAGALGFKCFLIESGVDEFKYATRKDLLEAMPVLARLGVPLLVHAELDRGASPTDPDPRSYRRYVQSRPASWEVEAIKEVVELAKKTGCRVHVVHLSAADALPAIRAAKDEGVPITVETCPHYLVFSAEEIPPGATHFKCAPPIRERENRERLWAGLVDGTIDFIVSDHSPCTPALRKMDTGDFDVAWGGIAGLQFSMASIWTEMQFRGLGPAELARWMCEAPARFAGLERTKGRITVGMDADFFLWDPDTRFTVNQVLHRHSVTPYAGRELSGRIHSTFLRGCCIYEAGAFKGSPSGQWQRARTEKGTTPMMNQTSPATVHVPFMELPDFASLKMGGRVLAANDEFFAPKENLIAPSAPIFIPDKYTEFGKWMDGWESRRKRGIGPGNDHDWCMLQLGAPCSIEGVVVDTSFFTGNFPELCALDGCLAPSDASLESLLKAAWKLVFPKTALRGGSQNTIAASTTEPFSHLRLRIFPDGGVARLRVHGHARPDWKTLKASGSIDLASVLNGAQVVSCNDSFFGPKDNLLLPGRAVTMGEGWETKRKRGPGHDWIVVKLAAAGKVRKIEIDTNHFKGNFPDSCSIEGCRYPSRDLTAQDFRDRTDLQWNELLSKSKLEAHSQNLFEAAGSEVFDYIRLRIYPDGGVSRLRLWGTPA